MLFPGEEVERNKNVRIYQIVFLSNYVKMNCDKLSQKKKYSLTEDKAHNYIVISPVTRRIFPFAQKKSFMTLKPHQHYVFLVLLVPHKLCVPSSLTHGMIYLVQLTLQVAM